MQYEDSPKNKTFQEAGLDQFGQSALSFSGSESNLKAKTMNEAGVPSNFLQGGEVIEKIIVDNVRIGYTQVTVSPGQGIQAAIDQVVAAGGGKVFLRNGTHTVNSDLILYSTVTIEGESLLATVIDFNGGPYSMIVEGSDPYSTGTVSATINSTTVTGSGTTWTADMIGQSILIDGDFYGIADVASTTSLTISVPFIGISVSGAAYVIATPIAGVNVTKVVIQNSSTHIVRIRYASLILFNLCAIYGGDTGLDIRDTVGFEYYDGDMTELTTGIYLNNAWSYTFETFYIYNCLGSGLVCDLGGDSTIYNFGISNCVGDGIKLTNTSALTMLSFSIDSNGSDGIEFVSGCSDNALIGGLINENLGNGVKFTATDDTNIINSIQIRNNGAYGINIANANCDNNILLANILANNTSGQVSDSGTGTKIKSNIGITDSA